MTNPICLVCTQAENRFPGRWCIPQAQLVEYALVPPCRKPTPGFKQPTPDQT